MSKAWGAIEQFSEDVDLAVDRALFDLSGDLTVRQLKKLRKQSSLFDQLSYLRAEIVLEVGARSLIEPTAVKEIKSLISENFDVDASLVNSKITTTVPEKTFLEKAFLLHEIFAGNGSMIADRKSRHLYDLEKMMDKDFAVKAVADNALWSSICRHRQIFTRVSGVDYSGDIRKKICLTPPLRVIDDWRQDYEKMQNTMIYGSSLSFDNLLKRMAALQDRFCELPAGQ